MATVEHKNLTGVDLHESKGVSTAAINTAYIANGAGSGTWVNPLASVNNANRTAITVNVPDISTGQSVFVCAPLTGKVSKVFVTLYGTIATANSIVTAKINGVPIGGLSITCTAAGSVAGTSFSGTSSSANSVAAGGAIEIITDGGSSNTIAAEVTILLDVS